MNKYVVIRLTTAAFLLSSCNRYVIKMIKIDAANQKFSYYDANDSLVDANKAVVREGDKISVTVTNYNPLIQTVSINPVQGNYFYSAPSPLISSFFPVTAGSNPASTSSSNPEITVSDSTKKTPPKPQIVDTSKNRSCAISDPLYKTVLYLNEYLHRIDTISKWFQCYYSNLSNLNSEFSEFKLDRTVTKECVCSVLTEFSNSISKYVDINEFQTGDQLCTSIGTKKCPPEMGDCPGSILAATDLFNANGFYKDYFIRAADSLTAIQNQIANLLKAQKYEEYLKRFASCGGTMDYSYFKNQKFDDDLKREIGNIQLLNKNYSDLFDKNISTTINEYSILRHLTYTTIQNNLAVENTDEFKANIVLANTTLPSTQTLSVSLMVTKAVKIDFSAGGFYSSLYNEISVLKKKSGTDSFYLQTGKASDFTLGPMGFINFHTQLRSDVNFGLFLGTGLAFNQNAKLVLAGGGSLLFGKYQRLIIHVGISFAQVDRISSLYADGVPFADASYKADVIQQWKNAFLFGISWNLSRN